MEFLTYLFENAKVFEIIAVFMLAIVSLIILIGIIFFIVVVARNPENDKKTEYSSSGHGYSTHSSSHLNTTVASAAISDCSGSSGAGGGIGGCSGF